MLRDSDIYGPNHARTANRGGRLDGRGQVRSWPGSAMTPGSGSERRCSPGQAQATAAGRAAWMLSAAGQPSNGMATVSVALMMHPQAALMAWGCQGARCGGRGRSVRPGR
jgi:hypothetical protein